MSETKNCPLCGTAAASDVAVCQCGYKFTTIGPAAVPAQTVAAEPRMAARGMSTIGGIMVAAGAVLAASSAFMDTTVSSDIPGDYSLGIMPTTSTVHNLGLLHASQAGIQAGLALFISGVIVLCAVAIIRQVASRPISAA